jgi:hypothetical protein
MLGANTHHPPEHPNNQMTSNTNIRCTVKKPRSALETDDDMHSLATTTSHQVMLPTIEIDKATVEGMKFDKSKEHEESNVTYTDRNMQHREEESKQKLMITRHQVSNMNKVKTAVKKPEPAFEAHETPHTLTTYPPEKSLQPSENAEPSPIIPQVRSLNPTKLKLLFVQDQDDLTATLAPQQIEKVHKDDSSDYEYKVEKVPFYKVKTAVRSVKRKYEVLAENEEIVETPTARDAVMYNSTHGDSALDDNDEYEPREHQTNA